MLINKQKEAGLLGSPVLLVLNIEFFMINNKTDRKPVFIWLCNVANYCFSLEQDSLMELFNLYVQVLLSQAIDPTFFSTIEQGQGLCFKSFRF